MHKPFIQFSDSNNKKGLWIKTGLGLKSVPLTCINPSGCPVLTLPNIGLIQGHCPFLTHYSENPKPLLFFFSFCSKTWLDMNPLSADLIRTDMSLFIAFAYFILCSYLDISLRKYQCWWEGDTQDLKLKSYKFWDIFSPRDFMQGIMGL